MSPRRGWKSPATSSAPSRTRLPSPTRAIRSCSNSWSRKATTFRVTPEQTSNSPREDEMADIKIFNPDGLAKPAGTYTHIAQAKTQNVVFIAGQVPSDASGKTVGKGDIEAQCAQVYANIHTALRAVGADWSNVVQFTS